MNLLALTFFLIQSPTVTVTENEDFDSRCFPAYLKQSIPDFELDEGDAFNLNLRDYIAAGDDDVTNSPKCTDVNPTISAGGDAVSGLSLNTSDLDNASYSGTASSADTGTLTITFDNSIGSAIVESIDWVVNAAETPSAGIPLPSTAYCVSKSGSNTNSGHPPNCWLNEQKVNSFTFQPGDDLYFEAGDGKVWNMTQKLDIDWEGTGDAENQRVIIGSFYVENGQYFINQPTNWSDPSVLYSSFTYPATPPVIQGPYQENCRNSVTLGGTSNKCPYQFNSTYRTDNWAQAVPATYFESLIDASGSLYVTIQDLEVAGSSGQCVKIDSEPTIDCLNNNPVCQQWSIVQRLKIHHCAGSAIRAVRSTNNVIRYNNTSLSNLAIGDQLPGWRADALGLPGGFRGGSAINIIGCYPCLDLVEANEIHDEWGENFGFYGIAAGLNGFILARGNSSANAKSVGLNIGATSDIVLEQNILAGDFSDTAGPNDPTAIALGRCSGVGGCGPAFWAYGHENDNTSVADSYGMTPGARVMRRNSILAMEHASGLHVYSLASRGTDAQKLETWDFNNTVYVTSDDVIRYSIAGASPVRIVSLENYNNLYINQAGGCGADLGGHGAKVDIDFNLFTILTTNVQCRGPNDVVSTDVGFDFSDFSDFSWDNFPDIDLFRPASTGDGNNQGTSIPRTTDYMSGDVTREAYWEFLLERRRWLPDCNTTGAQVPIATWYLGAATDYCGNVRSDDDIGALINAP